VKVRGALSPDGTQYYDGPDWGWQDLWLTPDRVLAFCTERGLPAGRVSLLVEGMLNQTWRIHCADHDRVLRVGRSSRTPEQVDYELPVVRAWAAAAPVVIAPEHTDVPVVDGHVLTLFPYVEGISGATVPSSIRNSELVPVLATLHRTSLELDLDQRPGFRSIDDHPRWFGWGQTRLAIMERYGRGRDVLDPIGVVDRAIEELDRLLGDWHRNGRLAARAVVHGDLNPRNQLYREDRLVGIIDTDELRVEPLAWEIAGLAYSDHEADPAQAWRDYLAAGGPLDPRDEDLLLPFARIGALSEIVWLTDAGEATHLAHRNLIGIAASLTGLPR
jgi:Ser/Thr protein kinase RdoA (MazF antagonist)